MGNKKRSSFITAHTDEHKKGFLICNINLKLPDKTKYPCEVHGPNAHSQRLRKIFKAYFTEPLGSSGTTVRKKMM